MPGDFDPYYRWLGIPPEEQPPDHYRLLGLRRFETDPEVISNASDQRMTHLRTFASGKRAAESQRLLNEVSAATRCLLDAAKKQAYDNELKAKHPAATAEPSRLPVARPLPLPSVPTSMPVAVRPIPVGVTNPAPPPAVVAVASPPPEVRPVPGPAISSTSSAIRRTRRRSSGLGIVVAMLLPALLVAGGGYWVLRLRENKPTSNLIKPPVTPITDPGTKKPTPNEIPSTNPSDDDIRRIAWYFASAPSEPQRGIFQRVAKEEWRKISSAGEDLALVEIRKTDKFILLTDEQSNLSYRLYDDHMESSEDLRQWSPGPSGKWIGPEEVAALVDAIVDESTPIPANEDIPILTFDGKGKARLTPSDLQLDAGKPFTIEFWFRKSSPPEEACGLIQLGQLGVSFGPSENEESVPCELFAMKWVRKPRVLPPDDKWHHLALSSDSGRLTLFLDGKAVHRADLAELGVRELQPIVFGSASAETGQLSFTGEMKSLQMAARAKHPPGNTFTPPAPSVNKLLAGASLNLEGVAESGPNTTNPPPEPKPQTPAPSGEENTIAERSPLPEKSELQAAQEAVKSVYGDRIRLAMKPEDRQQLAQELFAAGASDKNSPSAYALLQEAQRMAVLAIDIQLTKQVVAETAARFEIDEAALLAVALDEIAPKTLSVSQRDTLVDEAIAASLNAWRQGKPQASLDLATVATSVAAKGKNADQKKRARTLREHLASLKPLWEAGHEAIATLAQSPDDPEANAVAGRYFACVLGDLDQAARHFAKVGDSRFADAAQKQLEAESSDDARFAAAHAWHKAVEPLKPGEKLLVAHQVFTTCRELGETLGGLAKGQALKIVKELEPFLTEVEKNHPLLAKPKQHPAGLIARVFAGPNRTSPTPFVMVVADEIGLIRPDFVSLLEPYGTPIPRFTLAGLVVVEKEMAVQLQLRDCTATIGPARFRAGYQTAIDTAVPMPKGVYPITIIPTGPNLQFRVTHPDTMTSLLFHDEQTLQLELERIVPVPGGGTSKGRRID